MIVGNYQDSNLLHALEESDYRFYATGSRFFGGANAQSDWDFFVQDTPDVRDYLLDLGFYSLDQIGAAPYDMDSLTTEVFRCPYGESHIDMALVSNVGTKVRARDLIENLGLFPTIVDKSNRKLVWNRVIRYLEHGL